MYIDMYILNSRSIYLSIHLPINLFNIIFHFNLKPTTEHLESLNTFHFKFLSLKFSLSRTGEVA
jgi:hypothetical protein